MRVSAFVSLVLLTCAWCAISEARLEVPMTLVRNASRKGALCLDGSSPAYHLDRGFGAGVSNWLLQFEGGGWCNDVESCLVRAGTRRGSTRYMSKYEVFSGILSNNASLNPEKGSSGNLCKEGMAWPSSSFWRVPIPSFIELKS